MITPNTITIDSTTAMIPSTSDNVHAVCSYNLPVSVVLSPTPQLLNPLTHLAHHNLSFSHSSHTYVCNMVQLAAPMSEVDNQTCCAPVLCLVRSVVVAVLACLPDCLAGCCDSNLCLSHPVRKQLLIVSNNHVLTLLWCWQHTSWPKSSSLQHSAVCFHAVCCCTTLCPITVVVSIAICIAVVLGRGVCHH
jgi:hypothetical protein